MTWELGNIFSIAFCQNHICNDYDDSKRYYLSVQQQQHRGLKNIAKPCDRNVWWSLLKDSDLVIIPQSIKYIPNAYRIQVLVI